MKHLWWIVLPILIGLTACGSIQPTPNESPIATPAPAQNMVSPIASPTPLSPTPTGQANTVAGPASSPQEDTLAPRNLEARAIEDLAERMGISSTEITVISAIADEFPGANLGCPTVEKVEGGGASPAFVTAKEFVLEAGGTRYHYRGRGNQVIFCFTEE